MVQEIGVAWTIFRFRAHALLGAAGGIVAKVLQQLVAIDALELVPGEGLFLLEPVAEGTRQRVALHLPELRYADARGVHLQRSTHRGEEPNPPSISLRGGSACC